ncbi:unnamed protein product [Scytosiphon promiscuus]
MLQTGVSLHAKCTQTMILAGSVKHKKQGIGRCADSTVVRATSRPSRAPPPLSSGRHECAARRGTLGAISEDAAKAGGDHLQQSRVFSRGWWLFTEARRRIPPRGSNPRGRTGCHTMRIFARACLLLLTASDLSSSFVHTTAVSRQRAPGTRAPPSPPATTGPLMQAASAGAVAGGGGGGGGGDADAFERITLARRSTKRFDRRRAVPDDVLKKVLALALRAPSGFNIQPFECIVVTSEEAKQRLSSAMLGPNRERVLEAGATVVFASDLNSMKNIRKLTAMLAEEGWPRGFIKKVPLYLSVFSTGHNRFLRFPLFVLKKLAFAVVRRLGKGMPTVSGAETWAFKNTMLAVQELLLAATSNGLASCPMEGFDMRRMRKALRIPPRYSVPIVVSLGYPSDTERDFKTRRFPPEQVLHREEFGNPLEGVPAL